MKFKGKCGLLWIQSERVVQGNISMECEHEDGFYITALRINAEEECLKICQSCPYAI